MKQNYQNKHLNQNDNWINKPRHIDVFYNYIKKILFSNSRLNQNEIRELMEPINSIYTSVKMKTTWVYRENNERVLLHYRETAYIILDNFTQKNLNKIKISLLHDLREDTSTSFLAINDFYWNQVALWVEAISKKNVLNFIENNIELILIKETNILDDFWNLTKEIKEKIINNKLSNNEKIALIYYNKAKEKRKIEYFSRFNSFNSMKNYIKLIAKKYKINNLKEEDFDKITYDVFDVKFADRIHNLRTQWDPNNIIKVSKKIKETKDYLLKIAKKINYEAYEIMIELIYWLEIKLLSVNEDVEKIINN